MPIVSVYVSEKVKAKIEEYNDRNPYNKLNVSKVFQEAVCGKLAEISQ